MSGCSACWVTAARTCCSGNICRKHEPSQAFMPPPSHPAGMTARSHEHRAESLELCGCVVMTCSAVFFLFSSPTGFGGKPYAGPFRPAIKSFSLSEDFLSPVAFSINSSQTDKSLPIGPAALYRSSYSLQVRRYLVGR